MSNNNRMLFTIAADGALTAELWNEPTSVNVLFLQHWAAEKHTVWFVGS